MAFLKSTSSLITVAAFAAALLVLAASAPLGGKIRAARQTSSDPQDLELRTVHAGLKVLEQVSVSVLLL